MKRKKANQKSRLTVFIVCLLISFGTAFIGGIFTNQETEGDWYQSVRPNITPPNWIFPIVWNILFLLIALSLYFAWISAEDRKDKIRIGLLFGLNLFANAFWSYLYFGMHAPLLAFYDLIIIWMSTLNAMYLLWDIDRKSSWLLLPYLLWISFAGILNWMSIS